MQEVHVEVAIPSTVERRMATARCFCHFSIIPTSRSIHMADSLPLSFPALYSCAQSARSGPKVMPGVPLSAWRKDDHVLRCGICAKKFGLLRWKHHCRACGDVCCRRCLGFCLVDVPEQGVDLAYTCARCVQKNTKPTLVGDINWPFPGDVQGPRLHVSRSADSLATMAMSDCTPSPSTASPCSFSWSITPTASPPQSTREFDVVVSQYRNQKLHSVCSLLVDYLECVGGAIVLVQDHHLWVIAHKGLHPRVLHDPTFLSICSRALSTQTAFTVPDPANLPSTSSSDPSTFQFFGASPLFDVRETAGPALGCIVALDTRARTSAGASKMEVTLENLADHVMDLLAQEETILRIYASGDFKIFASAVSDTRGPSGSFSSSSSTGVSGSLFSSMHTRPRRSSSFASGDEYFSRNANLKGDIAASACRKVVEAAFSAPSLKKEKRPALGNSCNVSTLKAA
ncbi:hypothetical protein F441_02079 [Phytophthora nicotianae CJ01A1]|uniref:FYVE-type domain-containing protein n=3 Tax=Phytophthora nicotianae TaxID=4792 RepID=V9FUQ3_PHYNI|nr:hypothetical protein F443_02101 [Phytophthora nicotianae P1569]ETK95054.1 hypothetical protein L915_02015 [Phytophthora nicotianae]ETL48447.1 hypothetical protein L916_01971 [Phytophthora nicotianae]ETM54721.1 hypothetical protein L914_02002 [Phytophthora nicotianae]ETP25032.1 hypothetical protein F441_02079 [Phytophthora nicotianae CJ01A1]